MKKAIVWMVLPFLCLGILLGCVSTPKNYTLLLNANNGEDIITMHLSNLDQVATPVTPSRAGYRFDGWYWDDVSFMEAFDESALNGRFIDGVAMLYAKWTRLINISFQVNGGTEIASINEVSGSPIVLPTSTKLGHVMIGWYLDETLSTPCDWQTIPTEDTVLYAKWEVLTYTLSFETGSGSKVLPIMAPFGSSLTEPETPFLIGYTFSGWYVNPQYSASFSFSSMPASNLILYAKWVATSFSIDYELNGGNNHPNNPKFYSVETQNIDLHEASKAGYRFVGWYTNPSCVDEPVTALPLSSPQSLVLYAKWELILPALANGTFNLAIASPSIRTTFIAAAERYLLQSMIGGIPLYNTGTPYVFSTRIDLPMRVWIPNVGFGERFARMTEDDSYVTMANGLPGNSGEYTYRYAIARMPYSYNPWTATGDVDIDVNFWLHDTLYRYEPNTSLNGYVLNPSMAVGDPQPVFQDTNAEVESLSSTHVWRVTIQDHLTWRYHPLTDASVLAFNHEVLDTADFIATFRLALDNQWRNAVNGSESFAAMIANAQAYLEGTKSWEEVGVKKIDDETLEIVFTSSLTLWEVKAWLANPFITPIHTELYGFLKEANDGNFEYGTSPETSAYSGPYTFDSKSDGIQITLLKNPLFHSSDQFAFTHVSILLIEDNNDRLAAFQAGKLDRLLLITPHANLMANHPQLLIAPQTTSVRLMVNALGTVAKQRTLFPSGTWVPEPLLSNASFRRALYYAIDREALNAGLYAAALPLTTYLSTAFLFDPELGIPYRLTPQGMAVQGEWSPATFGTDHELASLLFAQALSESISAGSISRGTEANPTIIELQLMVPLGYSAHVIQGERIKTTIESMFQSTAEHVFIRVVLVEMRYPDLFLNALMYGEYDLAIGSSMIPAFQVPESLAIFCSDNRSGMTMNWGFDTSLPDIRVTYQSEDGLVHDELWSFDAIVSALSGEIIVIDGKESSQQPMPT